MSLRGNGPIGRWSNRTFTFAAAASVALCAGCDAPGESTTPSLRATAADTASRQSTTEAPSTAPPSTAPASAVEATDLEEMLVAVLGDDTGGVAVLIVRDGATTTLAVGERNNLGEEMTASTPSRVGSLTKPFVATIVLQLVDEGRVDLDASLATYLPDTPVGGDVTIRDLLRHRSGLNDYTAANDFRHDTLADRSHRFAPAELLAYIAAFTPAPAGERYSYSNTNYVLLGQLIERVDGVDLNTALRNRITGPLGFDISQLAVAGDTPGGGTRRGLVARRHRRRPQRGL